MFRFRSPGTLALALCFAGAVQPATAAPAAPIALRDCVGKPLVKPASVTLACADAGFIAGSLTWTGWGSSFAAARGIATVNDCTPSCAAGHDHTYPIVLIVDGRERPCPDGRAAYARITIAWPAKSPYKQTGSPATYSPSCRY